MKIFSKKSALHSVFASITLFFFQSAMALGPATCLDVSTIQTNSLDIVAQDQNLYIVSRVSDYDTPFLWIFRIANIDATSREDALSKGKQALEKLVSMTDKPKIGILMTGKIGWGCDYVSTFNNTYKIEAIAQ